MLNTRERQRLVNHDVIVPRDDGSPLVFFSGGVLHRLRPDTPKLHLPRIVPSPAYWRRLAQIRTEILRRELLERTWAPERLEWIMEQNQLMQWSKRVHYRYLAADEACVRRILQARDCSKGIARGKSALTGTTCWICSSSCFHAQNLHPEVLI